MTENTRRTSVDAWLAMRLGIPIEELSPEKLYEWQLKELRKTVQYARKGSRFYKKWLSDIETDDLRSLADLEYIPYTTESDLAENELDFLCVNPKEVNRVVTVSTTGTSGFKKRVSLTKNDQISSMIFIGVGFKNIIANGEKMVVMMSGGADGSIGTTVQLVLAQRNIETLIYGTVYSVSDAYQFICQNRPDSIVGIPNQIAAVSRYGRRFGNPEARHIKSVLLSADDIPDSLHQSVAELWGCSVFSHYGTTEMGIAGGVECEAFSGYHMRDCDLLFEIINTDEDGIGEIVYTTLGREAMPLIRYKTGDYGRFTETPCPCGSPMRRIEKVFGRRRNLIELSFGETTGGHIHLSEVGNAVFKDINAVDYECALSKSGVLCVTVKTFHGQRPDIALIRRELCLHPPVASALKQGFMINFAHSETEQFEGEANTKKILQTGD